MTNPQIQQTPIPAGNWNRGRIQTNSHSKVIISRGKLPPYGKLLAADIHKKPLQSVFIYTGSAGWASAATANLLKPRLLLPYGEDPQRYRWDIQGRDCVLLVYGKTEPRKSLLKLSRCLLEAGAPFVVILCPESFNGKSIVTVKARATQ